MNTVMLNLPPAQVQHIASARRTAQPATVKGNTSVKFQGSFASTFPTKAKVSARVKAQIESLSKTLNKSPEEVASAASSIGTHVMSTSFKAPQSVAMMPSLEKLEKIEGAEKIKQPDSDGSMLYSVIVPNGAWKTFRKANLTEIYTGRTMTQRVKDLGKKKEEVQFKYSSSEKEGAAALAFFATAIFPPAWPLMLFSVPTLLATKNRPYNSLVDGLNALEKAVELKKADPNQDLVLVTNNKNFIDYGKNFVHFWKMDILSNLDKPKAQ